MSRRLWIAMALMLLLAITAYGAAAATQDAAIIDAFRAQTEDDLDIILAQLPTEALTYLQDKISLLLANTAIDPALLADAVWIPVNGGTRYHDTETCSGMISPRFVTIEEATALGFTPCKRCYKTP